MLTLYCRYKFLIIVGKEKLADIAKGILENKRNNANTDIFLVGNSPF